MVEPDEPREPLERAGADRVERAGFRAELPDRDELLGRRAELPDLDELLGRLAELPDLDELLGRRAELPDLDELLGRRAELPDRDELAGRRAELPDLDELLGRRAELPDRDELLGRRTLELVRPADDRVPAVERVGWPLRCNVGRDWLPDLAVLFPLALVERRPLEFTDPRDGVGADRVVRVGVAAFRSGVPLDVRARLPPLLTGCTRPRLGIVADVPRRTGFEPDAPERVGVRVALGVPVPRRPVVPDLTASVVGLRVVVPVAVGERRVVLDPVARRAVPDLVGETRVGVAARRPVFVVALRVAAVVVLLPGDVRVLLTVVARLPLPTVDAEPTVVRLLSANVVRTAGRCLPALAEATVPAGVRRR